MSCPQSVWPIVSEISGTVSFCSSFVSLFPQIVETYQDKTVEGLSPYFLLAWLSGDVTSLVGALLTDQLVFQVLFALYFLFNDLFVCSQYYYYGVIHKNKLATRGHGSALLAQSRSTSNSAAAAAAAALLTATTSYEAIGTEAMVVPSPNLQTLPPPDTPRHHMGHVGLTLSWIGAFCYVGARVPQLFKNYKRKSTDGISPFLFATTLLGNVTYTLSILSSCQFLESTNKTRFLLNAAPFIFGSAGTILFDMVYFYQHYVLYATDMQLRQQAAVSRT